MEEEKIEEINRWDLKKGENMGGGGGRGEIETRKKKNIGKKNDFKKEERTDSTVLDDFKIDSRH